MISLSAFSALITGLTQAAGGGTRFVPIGAAYEEETLALFAGQAIARDSDGVVTIRVLPTTYPTDPYNISPAERNENLALAQQRAQEIQVVCQGLVSNPTTCVATALNIQTRSDAENESLVSAAFGSEVDGIFIPGGDQTIGMYVMANTILEDALEGLVTAGVPLGGNSAGAAVQSRYMIGGYADWAYAWHGLEEGALDLWYGPTETVTRGLRFAISEAIIDQHVLERGRLSRLLQATQQSPAGHIGLGVDWGTGVVVENQQVVTETAGWYAAVVVDEETYGAAGRASYGGPRQTLAIHNVAFHVLPGGPYGYDLAARRPVINGVVDEDAPDLGGRDFEFLHAPAGNGTLILSGDITADPTGPVVTRFAQLAIDLDTPTVVLAAGFATNQQANQSVNSWATRLSNLGVSPVQTAILNENSNMPALIAQLQAAGAIFVTGNSQPTVVNRMGLLNQLDLAGLWTGGRLLLLDNAMAAAAGEWLSNEPTPTDDDLEYQSSDSFLVDYVDIQPGLGLVADTVFEPRVLYDYLYGRLVSHVYEHEGVVAVGIERNTALEITPDAVIVLGESAVFVVDGRLVGVRAAGTNGVMALTWLFVDTFAPGDNLTAEPTHIYLSAIISQPAPPAAAEGFGLLAGLLAGFSLIIFGRRFV
jgi:cyanophycinase